MAEDATVANARAIFDQALEIDSADARVAYLAKACGADTGLRQEVENLLIAHVEARSFLESPAIGLQPDLDPPTFFIPTGTIIGHYKLLEPVGEGGYGVVFLAEQIRPVQRKVALKIIKAGMDTRQVIARFEAERQALALMDHPSIAKVFDAGTTEAGRPYFVMELVKGMPITKYCDERHLTPRQRLELFIQVCQAVQHAHQKGIIHRDLKPTNVLVALYDGAPVPKVIDFGVAKATGQQLTERTMFTSFGDVIGTPEYMSPEQAELNQLDIDTRSDIYSLGVLLYELLTGTTPIEHKRAREAALLEVLRVIREEEPPRPSTRLSKIDQLPSVAANRGLEPKKLSGVVHGELDWIVMRCLEKDRARRYETANGLARDIERYLHDEPVQAGPPSAWYRSRKFARRHRAALAVGAAVALTIVLALVGLFASNMRIRHETRQKEVALEEKGSALREAHDNAQQAQAARAVAEQQRDVAVQNQYVAHMQLAHKDWEAGHVTRMRDMLAAHRPHAPGETDRRGWEWYYLSSLLHRDRLTLRGHTVAIRALQTSPDGKRVASGSEDGTIRIWDAETGRSLNTLRGNATVWAVAWSPDGKCLAGGNDDGTMIVWDADSGEKLRVFKLGDGVNAVAWSSDGQKIAAGGHGDEESGDQDGTVRIWDSRSGDQIHRFKGASGEIGMVRALAWSPDDRYLIAGDNWQGRLFVWDPSTGQLLKTLAAHGHFVAALAWNADGSQFASASNDQTIKFWDAGTWKNRLTISAAHRGVVTGVSWGTDGGKLASAGEDGLIKTWEPATGRAIGSLRGHAGAVHALCWRRADGRLISGGNDASVKVWDPSVEPAFRSVAGHMRAAWSADGTLFAVALPASGAGGKESESVAIVDAATGRHLFSLPFPQSRVFSIAWSADKQKLALALDGKLVVRDVSTQREVFSASPHGLEIRTLHWHPAGRLLASGGTNRQVYIWDVDSGRQVRALQGHQRAIGSAVWSPDGTRIASIAFEGGIRIWNASTGEVLHEVAGSLDTHAAGGQYAACWSPTGDRVATCFADGSLGTWDAATGRKIFKVRTHTSELRALAWHPDGRRIASIGHDRSVKISDAQNGRELLALPGHVGPIHCVAWSPDGRQLATADSFEIRIWDAAPGYAADAAQPQAAPTSATATTLKSE